MPTIKKSFLLLLPLFCSFLTGEDKKVVFVAGAKSHGYFSHEHIAGSKLLARQLDEADVGLQSVVVTDGGYPKDPSVFDDAVAIVVYCDGGGRHLLNAHLKEFDRVMKRGLAWLVFTMAWRYRREHPGIIFLNGWVDILRPIGR